MTRIDDTKAAALIAFLREPAKGDVVDDRFTLRERIGEGGMGVVHAARDSRTGEEVAIKLLRSPERPRFEREVQALAALAHPAIVRFVASGVYRGTPYIAMERREGTTLAERLLRGPLSLGEGLVLGARIADGLAAAHRAGIVHRDVKPSNIFLDDGDPAGAKLLDFGVARPASAATLTKRGALVGTPGYMAPEQVRGESPVPTNADVFALGCVLFECVTGQAAFVDDGTHNALARILLEPAPGLRAHRTDAPIELARLLERMLDKDATRRPSAEEVARTLADLEPAARATQPQGSARSGAHGGPAARPSFEPGTIIDAKYRVERRIGEGGMGIVVAARHLDLGKRVALKFLRSFDPQAATRFLREARAASHIESEHVARVLDVGRVDDRTPYLVMEHLDGVDLAAHLKKNGPLRAEEAVAYVLQACDGVADAHRLGIVHRDLKPSNLFLTARHGEPFVKVLDFGISKLTKPLGDAHTTESTTASAGFIGSIAYMSPEQIKDSAQVDARTDVWALGVVLFELLSGKTPFAADNFAAIAARIVADTPTSLRSLEVDVPEALERLVSRCLEKSPESRPASVEELARELRRVPHLMEAPKKGPPRARRSRRWASIGGASLLAGLFAGYAFYTHRTGTPTDRSLEDRPTGTIDARRTIDAPEATPRRENEERGLPVIETSPDLSVRPSAAAPSDAGHAEPLPITGAASRPPDRRRPEITRASQTNPVPGGGPTEAPTATEPSSTPSRTSPEIDLRDPALLAR